MIVTITARANDYGDMTGVEIKTSAGYRNAMRVPRDKASTEREAIAYATPILLAVEGA